MTQASKVRVRYAPSPTGYLHVGGARTLLFNWLYARKHGGTLVLRVEDTDQARSTRKHEEMILSDVQRLALNYDEGPDKGGPFPPYRQSERLKIYADYARQLLERDVVYYCFCSDELLGQKREAAMKLGRPPHYDGTCARLSRAEADAKMAKGEKGGLRFRAPQKNYVLKDEVRGEIEFKTGMVGDFLITRTPGAGESEIAAGIGFPVYNFCCVIDDHAMGMTHIIRGEDHLSNTARQLMIYEAFDWKPPIFAHTAMVLGADRQKLSKRNGDTSVFEYLDQGYLPDTLINFLVLLGWWPAAGTKTKSGHPEILTRDELIANFNLEGLQKAPAVFDVQKLRWMNSQYLRLLPLAEITALARPYFEKAGWNLADHTPEWFESMIAVVRGEVQLLNELPKASELFLKGVPALDEEAKTILNSDPFATKVVDSLLGELESSQSVISAADVDAIQKKVAGATGAKGKSLFMPIRAIVTGKTHGPELKHVLPLLGRATAVQRIRELKKQAGL